MLSLILLFQKVLEKNKNKKYDRTIAARATPEMECSVQGREIQNKHTHAHTHTSLALLCLYSIFSVSTATDSVWSGFLRMKIFMM